MDRAALFMERKKSIATRVRDALREEDELEDDDAAEMRRRLSVLDAAPRRDDEDGEDAAAMQRMDEEIERRMRASSGAPGHGDSREGGRGEAGTEDGAHGHSADTTTMLNKCNELTEASGASTRTDLYLAASQVTTTLHGLGNYALFVRLQLTVSWKSSKQNIFQHNQKTAEQGVCFQPL